MTGAWLFKLAAFFTVLGMLLGVLLALYWRPFLQHVDRLLPPRHLRRAGVRLRRDKPAQDDQA